MRIPPKVNAALRPTVPALMVYPNAIPMNPAINRNVSGDLFMKKEALINPSHNIPNIRMSNFPCFFIIFNLLAKHTKISKKIYKIFPPSRYQKIA